MKKRLIKNEIGVSELVHGMGHPDCGALCSFEGCVRNHHQGRRVQKLIYQAYPKMAELELLRIQEEVQKEWPGIYVRVRHRIGELQVGDVAVVVLVWAPHRYEGFRACEAVIDRIKARVPIWKKEFYEDGTTDWVACHHQGNHCERE